MLHSVQQKRGINRIRSRLEIAEHAAFRALFPGLKPIAPQLLHQIQHSPLSYAMDTENVAFFAGFVASWTRVYS